jgi:hypothetical protein
MRKLLFRIVWDFLDLCKKYGRQGDVVVVVRAHRNLLPCSECRVHFRAQLQRRPLDDDTDVATWLWETHNAVNVLRGVDGLQRAAAHARDVIWTAVCSPYSVWDVAFLYACNYPSRGSYRAHLDRAVAEAPATSSRADVEAVVGRAYAEIVHDYAAFYRHAAAVLRASPALYRPIAVAFDQLAQRVAGGECEATCQADGIVECERVLHLDMVRAAWQAWLDATDQGDLGLTLAEVVERYLVAFADAADRDRLRYELRRFTQGREGPLTPDWSRDTSYSGS